MHAEPRQTVSNYAEVVDVSGAEARIRDALWAEEADDAIGGVFTRKDPTGDAGDFVEVAGKVDVPTGPHRESPVVEHLCLRPLRHEIPDGWDSLVQVRTEHEIVREYRRASAEEIAAFALAERQRSETATAAVVPTAQQRQEETLSKLTAAVEALSEKVASL